MGSLRLIKVVRKSVVVVVFVLVYLSRKERKQIRRNVPRTNAVEFSILIGRKAFGLFFNYI